MSDTLIDVTDRKVALSTIWIFVMFNTVMADIIGFIEPGTLARLARGETGFELTAPILVVISLIQVVPILMIPIARMVRRRESRGLNVAAAGLTLLYVIGGGNWESTSYPVFATLEVIAMIAIIGLACTWRPRSRRGHDDTPVTGGG
ncbi:MAG: DUF6326 family protein [Myxococcota bacterium]